MKKLLTFFFGLFLFNISTVHAESGYENILVFADMCEKISQEKDDSLSKARLRASDKAVVAAVSSLPVLELPRKEFDEYDFNVLVYKLVDNHVEDLNVKTVSQTPDKVCIEIKGFITGDNIITAVMETKRMSDERALSRVKENLGGKTSIQIHEEIEKSIYREAEITPLEETAKIGEVGEKTPEIIVEDSDTIVVISNTEDNEKKTENTEEANKSENKSLVYIAPLKLDDGSQLVEKTDIIRKIFSNNEYFELTDDHIKAGYIIKPNILRVKIDSINNITNRMQMVVMVEMEDKETQAFYKEHQNRFVLLSA